jgi:hypothetical protein
MDVRHPVFPTCKLMAIYTQLPQQIGISGSVALLIGNNSMVNNTILLMADTASVCNVRRKPTSAPIPTWAFPTGLLVLLSKSICQYLVSGGLSRLLEVLPRCLAVTDFPLSFPDRPGVTVAEHFVCIVYFSKIATIDRELQSGG